jgi:hypothetical protein
MVKQINKLETVAGDHDHFVVPGSRLPPLR